MTVWIVSLEWNQPPSEVTGDPGLVGAYWTEDDAMAASAAERRRLHDQGEIVYQYSMAPDSHCIACGERLELDGSHACRNAFPDDAEEFCAECGAELTERKSCDNDHAAWTIDVHIRELEIQGIPPENQACRSPAPVQP